MDESAVTGESDDVWKDPRCAPFMQSGSRVLEGQGRLLVTAVGLNSQQGQIFDSLGSSGGGLRYGSNLFHSMERGKGMKSMPEGAQDRFSLLPDRFSFHCNIKCTYLYFEFTCTLC